MAEIQFPEFPTPSQDDWEYYLSFGTPRDYLHEVARALQEDNRFFTDFRFLKLLYWYARRPKEHEIAIFHYEKCKATSSRLFFIKDQSYDIRRKNDSGYYEPFYEPFEG